jgi:hypothetical protein
MADRVWPSILVPSSEAWNPNKGAARSGGRSLANQEQVVEGPSGYATASLTIPCNTPAKVKAARVVIALGRSQRWLVGPFEYSRAPWATDAYGRRITPKLLRRPDLDGTAFADGGAVAIADTLIPATVTANAAMNATSLAITRPLGTVFREDVVSAARGSIEAGMFFSIANRLHLIVDVAGDTVTFRPWLRADITAGTPINLVSPKGTMRLNSDPDGLELQLSRTGTLTLDLAEAF